MITSLFVIIIVCLVSNEELLGFVEIFDRAGVDVVLVLFMRFALCKTCEHHVRKEQEYSNQKPQELSTNSKHVLVRWVRFAHASYSNTDEIKHQNSHVNVVVQLLERLDKQEDNQNVGDYDSDINPYKP